MDQRAELIAYLKELRDTIIAGFESVEKGDRFVRQPWQHASGGGGEISLLRGDTFEKAAVNWSAVSGDQFPMQDGSGPFFATGVSLITHMKNPYAPTVHFNIRYLETATKRWFGGGYDLTPMGFPFEEDRLHFHGVAEKSLAPFGVYAEYAQNARDYFYIPHRKKERGVGGIFFDHLDSGDFERDKALWKTVGDTFLEAILPIYRKRIDLPFTETEKQKQLEARAHYVEFNLLYDRGTKFGFTSGGNPEAILCSMPPLAKW
jgi:coproporphyrinogen III oxidase